MSLSISTGGRGSRGIAAVPRAIAAGFEDEAMREKLAVVRDTLIVLGIQLVFRAVMMLRRWNY
jgi:hypothetical protein